ncbi:DUF4142 domain-containing protein [Iningainema tapete]|uniref:DUF4142 domain-containing protein n=1 Tax=Iningainema tapete BLCC-T55 TaxID=2748662 RepID=A0A8J6XMQ2_9CYAN|nr:DUF4142 domain-containing protein [Iningainema tapete]MBD2777818.1 DUF4142 domain-containing protein [Iningainema tapete BLCC-T55]
MFNNTKLIKKFVGSFLGVAGLSTLIVPGIAQANINSGLSTSSNSVLAQNPTTTPVTPGGLTTPGSTTTTPSPRSTTAPSGTTGSPSSLSSVSDKEFITRAAQSDNFEIQTSQQALKRAQDPKVKAFAQQMIKEHTTSSKQLAPIAKKRGVTLPKDVGAENQALLTQLSSLKGKEFDSAYMQAQVQAHTNTLALYQDYIQQGQNAELKAFAKKIAPVVQKHLKEAQQMTAGS